MAHSVSENARATPPNGVYCEHFGFCGGCAAQDVAYDEQLQVKSDNLRRLFGSVWDRPIPVTGSPDMWHYRNRVDFNFAPKHYEEPPPPDFERETVLGYTRKGQWYWVFDVNECLIAPRGAGALLQAVRAWFRNGGLRAFNSRSGEGFLRVLTIREGKRTGESMVILCTSPGDFDTVAFTETVLSAFPATSIYRAVTERKARGLFAEEFELLHGADAIHERLEIAGAGEPRTLSFRISPLSFFQTNSLGAELVYGRVRRWVADTSPAVLYDLYGGSGGIALACADLVPLVRSVENHPAAAEDGVHNAEFNDVTNVFFTVASMKRYLQDLLETGGMEPGSAAVLDPPRSGLTPKPLARLVKCRPDHVLYVSCNPSMLAEELPTLLGAYDLENLEAVDMFPHTPHVEVLATLRIR